MKRLAGISLLCALLLAAASPALAQDDAERARKIASAMSAAPPSIAEQATIRDWPAEQGGEMPLIREGSDAWTCLPDMPDTPGTDPMCLDKPWLKLISAWVNKTEPDIQTMGFGYMLQGGTPGSNADPYAKEPTADNEWIAEEPPHIMIVVPDNEMLSGLPSDPENGGPWVMWGGTPYAHIMAPTPKYTPETGPMTSGSN